GEAAGAVELSEHALGIGAAAEVDVGAREATHRRAIQRPCRLCDLELRHGLGGFPVDRVEAPEVAVPGCRRLVEAEGGFVALLGACEVRCRLVAPAVA